MFLMSRSPPSKHTVAAGGEGGRDAGDPEGGRTHVHPAPSGAEVHGDAEEFDMHATTLPHRGDGPQCGTAGRLQRAARASASIRASRV